MKWGISYSVPLKCWTLFAEIGPTRKAARVNDPETGAHII